MAHDERPAGQRRVHEPAKCGSAEDANRGEKGSAMHRIGTHRRNELEVENRALRKRLCDFVGTEPITVPGYLRGEDSQQQ